VNNFDLISCATADELARAVASAWLDEIEMANRAGKTHCVALSGDASRGIFLQRSWNKQGHENWERRHAVPPNERTFFLGGRAVRAAG